MKKKLSVMVSKYPDKEFAGRSNKFHELQVTDLGDCRKWINKWDEPYWFIIDADDLIIYVSGPEVVDHAKRSAKINWYVDITDVRV